MDLGDLETVALIAHPAHPPLRVRSVIARVLSFDANWCVLRWKLDGAADLVVPAFAGRQRADGLWQTTCFELFVATAPSFNQVTRKTTPARVLRQAEDERVVGMRKKLAAYSEFNFSPGERWAAYDFAGYRTGMTERAITRPPVITPRRGGDVLICDVAIPTDALPPLPWRYGLTAVVEEIGGVKSYWAMAHPPEKPDFHDPACLAASLAAPGPNLSSPRA